MDGSEVVNKNVQPCTLDKATQSLIKLIFSNDMFQEQMETMNLGKSSLVSHSLGNGGEACTDHIMNFR